MDKKLFLAIDDALSRADDATMLVEALLQFSTNVPATMAMLDAYGEAEADVAQAWTWIEQSPEFKAAKFKTRADAIAAYRREEEGAKDLHVVKHKK